MPFKDKERELQYRRDWRAKLKAKDPQGLRAKEAASSRTHYWRNPDAYRKRSRDKTVSGEARNAARSRRYRLTDGYVKRCLIQRGWNATEIEWAMNTPDVLETIKVQIQLKREIRHGNQQPG